MYHREVSPEILAWADTPSGSLIAGITGLIPWSPREQDEVSLPRQQKIATLKKR
jgi:hypothetical protein